MNSLFFAHSFSFMHMDSTKNAYRNALYQPYVSSLLGTHSMHYNHASIISYIILSLVSKHHPTQPLPGFRPKNIFICIMHRFPVTMIFIQVNKKIRFQ